MAAMRDGPENAMIEPVIVDSTRMPHLNSADDHDRRERGVAEERGDLCAEDNASAVEPVRGNAHGNRQNQHWQQHRHRHQRNDKRGASHFLDKPASCDELKPEAGEGQQPTQPEASIFGICERSPQESGTVTRSGRCVPSGRFSGGGEEVLSYHLNQSARNVVRKRGVRVSDLFSNIEYRAHSCK